MTDTKQTKRQQAFDIYKEHDGKIDLTEIARMLGSPPGTVRGWKSRYRWDKLIGKSPPETKSSVATKKRSVTRNVTSPKEVPKAVESLNSNDELTDKQKLFCLYYLQYYNATKAYQLAYDVDWKSANTAGPRLLVNVGVQNELDTLKKTMTTKVFADAQQLINELLRQANSDIGDYLDFKSHEYYITDDDGEPVINEFTGEVETYKVSQINLKDSSQVDTSLIQEVKRGKDGVSIKLLDKQKALLEALKRLEASESSDTSTVDWKQAVINAANKRVGEADE